MADYATSVEYKARFFPAGSVDTVDDTVIAAMLTAVSRLIDRYCARVFDKNGAAEDRYYTAEDSVCLFTDDIVSVTTLYTDSDGDRTYEDTWAVTDFDLMPPNQALDAEPYTRIEVTPQGHYAFPVGIAKGVKINGIFGWYAVPEVVREACLLQTHRLFKRRDAPFGVMGSAEMGQVMVVPKLDPDIEFMLAPLRRLVWV